MDELLERALAHEHELVDRMSAYRRQHSGGLYNRVNVWLAVRVTGFVGSMTCAYIFTGVALTSLPSVLAQHSLAALIQWLSTQFLQLVLLSVLMVGTQVLAAQGEARAIADHQTLQLLHDLNVAQLQILQELHARRTL